MRSIAPESVLSRLRPRLDSVVPVVYVTDAGPLATEDVLDLRYLQASAYHELRAVVADDAEALLEALSHTDSPVNLVVVGGYGAARAARERDRLLFRERVARVFLVGGHAAPFVPIDPRLAERHPERFAASGDPRVSDGESFSALLVSGDAIIWLPRDLCLWRVDVMDLTEGVVLLSTLPAFCLARQPDPILWLRLFRTIPATVEADATGRVTAFATKSEAPNLYVVVGVDGAALTRELIQTLKPSDTISP